MLFYMIAGEEAPMKSRKKLHIDEGLFPRIAQGERAALEELYQLAEPRLYAYALSLLKHPDDAKDVVQDAFLKVRSAAHLYQPMGRPLAWMFTIVKNLARNVQAKQNRFADVEEGELEDSLSLSYISDPTDRMAMQAALTILSEEERQIVLLHVLSGMKHREIAAILDVPLSTALSKYNRSIKKLRTYVETQERREAE